MSSEDFESEISREKNLISALISRYNHIMIGGVTLIVLLGVITYLVIPAVVNSQDVSLSTMHTNWYMSGNSISEPVEINGLLSVQTELTIKGSDSHFNYYFVNKNEYDVLIQRVSNLRTINSNEALSEVNTRLRGISVFSLPTARGNNLVLKESFSPGNYYLIAFPAGDYDVRYTSEPLLLFVTINQNPFLPLFIYILVIVGAAVGFSFFQTTVLTKRLEKIDEVPEEEDIDDKAPEVKLPPGAKQPSPSQQYPGGMPQQYAPPGPQYGGAAQRPPQYGGAPQQRPQQRPPVVHGVVPNIPQHNPYGQGPVTFQPLPPENPYQQQRPQQPQYQTQNPMANQMPPQQFVPAEVKPIAIPVEERPPVEESPKVEDPLNPEEEAMTEDFGSSQKEESIFEEDDSPVSEPVQQSVKKPSAIGEKVKKPCGICGYDIEVEKSKIPVTVPCPLCMASVEFK